MDELAVGDPIEAGSGIDTDDPETAEIAFALAAVAIGIYLGTVDSFSGGAEEATAPSPISLGLFEYFLSSCASWWLRRGLPVALVYFSVGRAI